MEYVNTQYLLNKRPKGMPSDECWRMHEEKITSLKKNEILIEVQYLSIDPYMRGRMNDGVSYASPAKLGDPMTGETAGVVVESKSNLFNIGDKVCAHKGWQTYIKTKDTDLALLKVPNNDDVFVKYNYIKIDANRLILIEPSSALNELNIVFEDLNPVGVSKN